jgi:hypothetical protein
VTLAAVGLLAVLCVGLLGLSALTARSNWHVRAEGASLPFGEHRVVARVHAPRSEAAALGYREMQAGLSEADADPAPPSFDPARDRGTDARVLREGRSLALRFRLALGTEVHVRVDVHREGDDVVLRAYARPPPARNAIADWRERLDAQLAPMLDDLLEQLTGVRPATLPRTRVAVPVETEEPGEREARRAIERRGWPKQ